MEVKKTERGWAGHFCCAERCKFRRNTLLEFNDIKIVVSTVGLMKTLDEKKYEKVNIHGYFETKAFYSDEEDKRYNDADVEREVNFESNWYIKKIDADDKANEMHEKVVKEISDKLKKGFYCA